MSIEGNVFGPLDSGWVQLIVYDQPKQKNTLANIASSIVTPVTIQEDIIYKGLVKLVQGAFKIEFVMPKEMTAVSKGIKMECYANNGLNDAWWSSNNIFVTPNSAFLSNDTVGPLITSFIRNKDFEKNHFWTLGNEPLYISLKDTSGIQSSGNVLGHDLELYIDNNIEPYVLNQLYVSDVNTYQSGSIVFNLPLFNKGKHQLVLRAWDLIGNMSVDTLVLFAPDSSAPNADKLRVYPNPINQNTMISFDVSFIPNNDWVSISIADANGNIIQKVSQQLSAFTNYIEIPLANWGIHLSNLAAGIYYCKVEMSHNNKQIVLANKMIKML